MIPILQLSGICSVSQINVINLCIVSITDPPPYLINFAVMLSSPSALLFFNFCILHFDQKKNYLYVYTECSLCRLIRYPGSFLEHSIGRYSGIPRQTEGHSFSDHLISESVSVAPSSVTESSLYSALFRVFMTCVRYNLE
jgi:hypothetical protein